VLPASPPTRKAALCDALEGVAAVGTAGGAQPGAGQQRGEAGVERGVRCQRGRAAAGGQRRVEGQRHAVLAGETG